jgi:CDP-glycerol glycerophosphotransferase
MLTKISYIVHAYLALIYSLLKRNDQKNIWLIGGHSGKLYTDNAKVFHQYLRKNHPHIKLYWIIDKDAPIKKIIQGNLLVKGSIRSYLYFYRAKVVLFSETLHSDIAPFSFILPLIKKYYHQTFKVYLSHGTIALKKMPQYQGRIGNIKKQIFQSYDLAIASTPLAQEAMKGYHINPSSIVLAGSARHDQLYPSQTQERTILVAPTWRNWLMHHPNFEKSDFFIHYQSLLASPTLHHYLETNGIHLCFYLHHMFHQYLHHFEPLESSTISILPQNSDISKEVMQAQLMITDYSSLCSDFYYLKKPILFFQFDQERYIQDIGSEIDLKKSTFGEIFDTKENLIEYIIHHPNLLGHISKKQQQGEKFFLHFKDKNNCLRIYNAISNKLPQKANHK